MQLSTTTIFR